jgi:hypothetical protein
MLILQTRKWGMEESVLPTLMSGGGLWNQVVWWMHQHAYAQRNPASPLKMSLLAQGLVGPSDSSQAGPVGKRRNLDRRWHLQVWGKIGASEATERHGQWEAGALWWSFLSMLGLYPSPREAVNRACPFLAHSPHKSLLPHTFSPHKYHIHIPSESHYALNPAA